MGLYTSWFFSITNCIYCSSHCPHHLVQRWHHSSALCLQACCITFFEVCHIRQRDWTEPGGPSFHWAMILALEVLSTKGNFQDSDTTFLFSLLILISSSHFATQNFSTSKFHYSVLKSAFILVIPYINYFPWHVQIDSHLINVWSRT